MANDYIPRPDAQLHAWQSSFVTYVNGHLADLGHAAGVRRPVDGLRGEQFYADPYKMPQ